MGKLDLELGGRQKKKNTANASMEEEKHESQLFDNNESKKINSTAVMFKLGHLYCVVLCLLSSLKLFYFTELQIQNGYFRMRSCSGVSIFEQNLFQV